MKLELFEGKWELLKDQVRAKWPKLTDKDLVAIRGKSDQLVAKLREHYGYDKDEAKRQFEAFVREINPKIETKVDTKIKPAHHVGA